MSDHEHRTDPLAPVGTLQVGDIIYFKGEGGKLDHVAMIVDIEELPRRHRKLVSDDGDVRVMHEDVLTRIVAGGRR